MKKRTKIIIIVISIIVVATGAFLIYVSDYYKADDYAVQVMTGSGITANGNLTILSPEQPSDIGLIFYPGGKVEEAAYLPLLQKLCQNGITCVLVKMPFHLAVFSPNAADDVFDQLLGIDKWFIAGHSLGGAMASSYASKNQDRISGVVLLGAYAYGDISLDKTVTIYGSEDLVLDRSKIDYTDNVSVIEGGNHAQFGAYGAQKGDGVPTITADEQQDMAADIIISFISNS